MGKLLLILLSTFAIFHSILASYNISLVRRGQNGDVSYYLNNVDAISKDLMKSNQPREECVFYVNTQNSNRSRDAAIAFAEIRNTQLAASGRGRTCNTLYDAFDCDLAFGDAGTLMQQATGGGPQFRRKYFRVTSGEYAKLCRGTVWLIAKKGEEIWEGSIWITDEYPQLIRPNSGVREILQIDPAEVDAAIRTNDPNRTIRPTPYKRPPGTTPPRSIEPIPYKPSSKASIDLKVQKYSRYPDVADGHLEPQGMVSPKCDMSDSSHVPYNVFDGVFGRFCQKTLDNPLNRLSQIVDSKGYAIPIRKRSLVKRTPPPNPDAYEDYKFSLSWSGGKGTRGCRLSCNDAFKAATASPCGHTAGEQNIMSTSGTIDAGCGEYRWDIIKPAGSKSGSSPPIVSAVKCNAADAFGKHKDINPGLQKQYTRDACAGSKEKNIKPGDADITFKKVTKGASYNYKISWIPGCKSAVSEMNIYRPLTKSGYKDTCFALLLRTYTDCNNGGIGGSVDVGCVRYEFHP